MAADGVDLVDEDDAGRALLGLLEHVAHTRRADADEHLDEVGAADGEERHLGFAGNRLGEQRLAGARRADQQHAARDAAAELLELLRVFQEVNEFLDFFFGFVATGNVSEGGRVVGLVEHARLALAEAECAALAAALHLAHEVHPDADQQQERAPADQDRHQQRLLFARLDFELDVVLDQVAGQAAVEDRAERAHRAAVGALGDDLDVARPFLDLHAGDAPGVDFTEELGVADGIGPGGTLVELLEDREQDQCNHQPDSDLRKPLIVHRGSLCLYPNQSRCGSDADDFSPIKR